MNREIALLIVGAIFEFSLVIILLLLDTSIWKYLNGFMLSSFGGFFIFRIIQIWRKEKAEKFAATTLKRLEEKEKTKKP